MKRKPINKLFLIVLFFLEACATPRHIYDPLSMARQKELRQARSKNVFADVGINLANTVIGVALETGVAYDISEQQFKKIKLLNFSSDTMYVNMLTDVFWDKNNYCDFMDIRIPPKSNCKVMVPIDAAYNLW
ncbi:MAG: hypothetical protein ACK5M7_17830 [Draconibacterium sp.]